MNKIRIGQFSQSPNILVIKKLNLLPEFELEISNVQSSPGQFQSLESDELDIALTSPDNVLLFGTTPENPIGIQCELNILRSIDKGLKLSLVSNSMEHQVKDLQNLRFSIDSPASGFSFLLKSMARKLGARPEDFQYVSGGSTPKRLVGMTEGEAEATILNAESVVKAEELGYKNWINVSEVSPNYLGTVLCAKKKNRTSNFMEPFLSAWENSTKWLLEQDFAGYSSLFEGMESKINNTSYFSILQHKLHGLTAANEANLEALESLIEIRRESGGYVPAQGSLQQLFD
jgi:ABC-type nitrate/sulfonate/bicarbonate transport system substrate-binding protein